MSAEEPLEDLAGKVLEGVPVDWDLAETKTAGASQGGTLHALRDLERIASASRNLQRRLDAKQPEQWGHLTILELASAGNSGEIWRAWDVWLEREVALKFLFPASEEGDDTALLDEARALARVRHPGVVDVYGIGEHGGRIGMWMELLVGSTLEAEVERRGPLPPHEVAEIGLELCRALEAIGAAGLVHRDIKPANIVRESNGRIVLTDFGLGQRRGIPDREPWRSSGTPVFMSPERLAGEPATPRSDLYALGITLRWALTGRCPFRARTLEELRAEVASGPGTSLRAERPDAPAALIAVIDRAMAPRAEDRFVGAAQMAEGLEQVLRTPEAKRRQWRIAASVASAILVVGAGALFLSRFSGQLGTSPPVRFAVAAPQGLRIPDDRVDVAVSPNGRLLVFAAMDSAGVQRLWLRPLESLTARPLEGTELAVNPFWSPDSRFIAFFADMKLQKTSVNGGAPEVLCRALDARGGTWSKDGTIVFAPEVTGPLCRVSAEGGAVTEIQRPNPERQETALRWPQFLPDGKRFLFVSLPPREEGFDVFVASTDSRGRQRVMSAGCAPIVVGERGVVVASNGRLMFQKLSDRPLRPAGASIALGPAPFSDVSVGQPLASSSRNGVLAYLGVPLTSTRLDWLDRAGRAVGTLAAPEGRYESLYFAPDGRKLLAGRRDSPTSVDLWLIDLDREEARRFSQGSQSRLGGKPVWSPDGSQIAFNSNRSGRTYIYKRLATETGEEQLLYQSQGQFNEVLCWSPDGRYLIFQQASPATGWDLWMLPLDRPGTAIPYLRSRFNEYAASISPDGRWLVYTTDASGKAEVYVRSFPSPGVEHLATNLHAQAYWSKNGRELIVQDGEGRVWSVPVSMVPTFRAGKPQFLFQRRPEGLCVASTPAGDRFLESSPAADEPANIAVDVNFLARVGR